MCRIRVLDSTGHTTYEDLTEEEGRELFDHEKSRGRAMIRTDEEFEGIIAHNFDIKGDYISVPPLAGG